MSTRDPPRLRYFVNDMQVLSGAENLRTYQLRSFGKGGRSKRVCCTRCFSTMFTDHMCYMGKFVQVSIDYCGDISPPLYGKNNALNVAGEWPEEFTPLKDTGRDPYPTPSAPSFFSHTFSHEYGGFEWVCFTAPYFMKDHRIDHRGLAIVFY